MEDEPVKTPEVLPLTESPPAVYTSGNEPAKPQATHPVVVGVTDILEDLIAIAKEKMRDPKAVRKLSIPELLEQIATLFKAMKSSNIVINNNTSQNMDSIRRYAQGFDAADKSRGPEVRAQLRNKLKRRPQ